MEWENSDWEQERKWRRWCGPHKKGRQSWQAPMEMALKINPRGLNCPKSSVGGCFLFGWKLVNTYCKLECRPIQLLPIILYQNNFIWGCPVNYFDLDLPEVWLTLCVYSRSTNKKKNHHQHKAWERLQRVSCGETNITSSQPLIPMIG